MPLPPAHVTPTMRELIEKAIEQGCEFSKLKNQLVGPRGPVDVRYLRRGMVIYPLPNLPDDWRLTPTLVASITRALGITGYEHLTSHLD
jgi:hypothetical protein